MTASKEHKPPGRQGSIIVVSAPSGAGKTTLTKRLLASVPRLKFSVSHTTRPARRGEKNGRDYFFISLARFKRMIAREEFAEWADVFGHYYGTTWRQIRAAQKAGLDLLLDIDVQGHRKLKRELPEAVSIFILPPSYQALERRLRHRHMDTLEVVIRRLATSKKEITYWREYDYLIVNDRLGAATEALRAVVLTARFRRAVQEQRVESIFKSFGG
jgi:guanylate kinase